MRASVAIGFLVNVLRHALHIALVEADGGLDPSEESQIRASCVGPDKLVELIDKCVEADFASSAASNSSSVIESVLEQFVRTWRA